MSRDFFDPTPEQQNVILIDATTLRKAERLIESCEACNPEGAEIPFDNILDRVTGSDPSVSDYLLQEPAKCPGCRREILEKTLVGANPMKSSQHEAAPDEVDHWTPYSHWCAGC
jgi:hypothetical protein